MPAAQEQGLADFDASPWTILALPAGVPKEPREPWRAAIEKTFEDRERVTRLAQRGAEYVSGMTIAQLQKKTEADDEVWEDVSRKTNIKRQAFGVTRRGHARLPD